MAYRIADRNKQIPNGFKFIQAETGWQAPRFASFNSIVQNLINHRKSRPDLVTKHNWRVDQEGVEHEVEQFNVRICLQHGWTQYLIGGNEGAAMLPKTKAPSAEEAAQVNAAAGRAKKIWSGVRTLEEWIDSGAPPVPVEHAERRAAVCVKCPMNTQGDFTSWFTVPAAGAIKRQIQRLQERKLATSQDDKLNVCSVCLCPLKLKVHTPLEYIKAHMIESVLGDLRAVPGCWVVAEVDGK